MTDKKVSFEIELENEKGTQEYRKELYDKMLKLAMSFSDGLLKESEKKVYYQVRMSYGWRWKVVEIEIIHRDGYGTVKCRGYYDSKEKAEIRKKKLEDKLRSGKETTT